MNKALLLAVVAGLLGAPEAHAQVFGQAGALPPTGAAGGDLSGTYPNPTVAQLLGKTWASPGNIGTGTPGTVTGTAGTFGDSSNTPLTIQRAVTSGNIQTAYKAHDSNNAYQIYAQTNVVPDSSTAGAYAGYFSISVANSGALAEVGRFTSTGLSLKSALTTLSGDLLLQSSSGKIGMGANAAPTADGAFGELRVDQNAVTNFKVLNATVGTLAAARYEASTGTANSYVLNQLFDNNGSPYFDLSAGSGVLHAYFDMPDFNFRSAAGTSWAGINSSGVFSVSSGLANSVTLSGGATNPTIGVSSGSLAISASTVFGSTIFTGASQGLTQTCTVNQAKTLIFTNGLLTGGTCNS